jgi:hypothetical protein
VTSLSLSASTHYPGIRPRNQLVPWDLHAFMESFLMSDSGLTSLTSNWMIPGMFDFISSIHIHWNVEVPWESLTSMVTSLTLVNGSPLIDQ